MLIIWERATRVWQSVLLVTFPTIPKAVASSPVKNCHVLGFTVHAWQASPGVDTKEPTPLFSLGDTRIQRMTAMPFSTPDMGAETQPPISRLATKRSPVGISRSPSTN
jgi:hypothetical protein